MEIEYTGEQCAAIYFTGRYLSGDWEVGRPFYSIGGYAGTGKTTVAKGIKNEAKAMKPIVCAFTGKAACRLREKGLTEAQTIHSSIYTYDPAVDKFCLNEDVDGDYFLIDEGAMVSTDLWNDILTFNRPVVLILDPGQLEPVGADPRLGKDPNIILNQIHRQAACSGIIRFASDIRLGRGLAKSYGAECQLRRFYPKVEDLMWADVTIVGTNATRHRFNRLVRRQLGNPGNWLTEGEQIICLQNNRDWGVFNGQLFTSDATIPSPPRNSQYVPMTSLGDGKSHYIPVSPRMFGRELRDGERMPWSPDACLFDYAYALTCHKAQGSEWDKVVVYDEGFGRTEESKRRWKYTAVTRAAKELRYFGRTS